MNKESEENKNNNFSLEAKFESMIKIAKEIIKENNNNSDCSMEIALAYDVANYLPKILDNSISKENIEDKKNELEKQYKEALEENSTEAFILKCQIEILKELLKGE